VPAGWKLEARADGDLDGDGTPDVAFVLHGNDPALVVKNDGLGEQELDTNPRVLVVVLRRGSRFELAVQNRTLIARRDDPSMEDPFDDDALEIRRGSLRVSLRLFMTAGGWTMFRSTFTFRLDRGAKAQPRWVRSDHNRAEHRRERDSQRELPDGSSSGRERTGC
jgi:hypothetical protein